MPKPVNVKVMTMDAELEFAIQQNTTGKQLFDQVVKTIGLREIWYFGLQYVDTKNCMAWLKLNKKVQSQDIKKPTDALNFRFRAKFYPEDVSEELIQEVTQRMFYLQVKEAILSDEIYCPPETAVLLASYACQIKFGDYNKETCPPGFLAEERLLPPRVIEQHQLSKQDWEDKIINWYREHSEVPKETAIMEYLKIAQDLEMYGVNYFEITNKKGTELYLGVDALGLNVYDRNDKLTPKVGFPWSEIKNISFNDRRFIIKPIEKKSPDFVFFAPRLRINKRILALCMGNHELYMRRRKPDSIEVQQMRAQAEEEREKREQERMMLRKAKEAREVAEKEKKQLEERLRVMELRNAEIAQESQQYQNELHKLESVLEEERKHAAALEDARQKQEQLRLEMEQYRNMAEEEKERLSKEHEEVLTSMKYKEAEAAKANEEVENALRELEEVRKERANLEEKTKRLETEVQHAQHVREVAEVEETEEEEQKEYKTELSMMPNGSANGDQRELDRETALSRNERLQNQLKTLSEELKQTRHTDKVTTNDITHEDNQRKGIDKFKTLRQIRQGNTKKRVDEYECM